MTHGQLAWLRTLLGESCAYARGGGPTFNRRPGLTSKAKLLSERPFCRAAATKHDANPNHTTSTIPRCKTLADFFLLKTLSAFLQCERIRVESRQAERPMPTAHMFVATRWETEAKNQKSFARPPTAKSGLLFPYHVEGPGLAAAKHPCQQI